MFLSDPTELIRVVEEAWASYVQSGDAVYERVSQQVVTWKFAPDSWSYLPNHPFAHLFEVDDYSPWRPRTIRYLESESAQQLTIRHGLDEQGRVVVAGNRIVVYGDGYHDILMTHRQRDRTTDELSEQRLVYQPDRKTGFAKGRVTRYFTNQAGRIERMVRLSDEGLDPDLHFRIIETFQWKDDRLTDSFVQWFQRGLDDPDEEPDPAEVRHVNDQCWESLHMKSRTEYSYEEDGRLAKVAEFTPEGKQTEVRYTFNPNDTVAGLSKELVKLLGNHLVKAIKNCKAAYPIQWVALQYSAEHAHCGLPTEVLLSSDPAIHPFDWEAYEHHAVWPPAGRVGQKYEDLQRRFQLVVESLPEYADDFQPRPYREVLWQASRHLYDKLSGKRFTANNFAVFPIDDHGDVDPLEDLRESLPTEIAQQVIDQAG